MGEFHHRKILQHTYFPYNSTLSECTDASKHIRA